MGRAKKQKLESLEPISNKSDVVSYIVISPFQDAKEYQAASVPNQYAIGDDVSHFEEARLDKAMSLGLVERNITVSIDDESAIEQNGYDQADEDTEETDRPDQPD